MIFDYFCDKIVKSVTMIIDLNLNNISALSKVADTYSRFGRDYIFSHLKIDGDGRSARPDIIRFDGLSFILCLRGEFDIEVNSTHYTVTPGSLVVLGPNRVLSPSLSMAGEVEIYTLFLSPEFMSDINFDLNVVGGRQLMSDVPIVALTPEQTEHMCRYFDLLHLNTRNNGDADNEENVCSRNIARNLIAAILYQLIYISETYRRDTDISPVKNRKLNYAKEFFDLVRKYHTRERSVAFYAGKLFISPKYLSLIIKENTGRSATEWIDSYVIMAAKNLLRFSGENIQQVAYRLNFSNQSAFGKYFKHLTGMSPTAFKEQ